MDTIDRSRSLADSTRSRSPVNASATAMGTERNHRRTRVTRRGLVRDRFESDPLGFQVFENLKGRSRVERQGFQHRLVFILLQRGLGATGGERGQSRVAADIPALDVRWRQSLMKQDGVSGFGLTKHLSRQ